MTHHCHWPGCQKEVPPQQWGCSEHWYTLPKLLRDAIWRYYVPGQEISKTPSEKYLAVAEIAQIWIGARSLLIARGQLPAIKLLNQEIEIGLAAVEAEKS